MNASERSEEFKRRIDTALRDLVRDDAPGSSDERLEQARVRLYGILDEFTELHPTFVHGQTQGRLIYELPPSERDAFMHVARARWRYDYAPADYSPAHYKFMLIPSLIDTLRPLFVGVAGVTVYLYLATSVFAISLARVRAALVEMLVVGAASYVCWLVARIFEKRMPRDPAWYEVLGERYGR
jgi:hypothetical protein